ncbi:hypothetical protein NDU88_002126 [Pleurodeles waltl]|uniref:Uncharacterized protein n=1 Tax=Pleurodeles waltl TaxID=8319 RepID=A0AAV7WPR2_PLEWA|nr:hypothetical protein NDU88_002126 [Pleurodeles waltl]
MARSLGSSGRTLLQGVLAVLTQGQYDVWNGSSIAPMFELLLHPGMQPGPWLGVGQRDKPGPGALCPALAVLPSGPSDTGETNAELVFGCQSGLVRTQQLAWNISWPGGLWWGTMVALPGPDLGGDYGGMW